MEFIKMQDWYFSSFIFVFIAGLVCCPSKESSSVPKGSPTRTPPRRTYSRPCPSHLG